MAKTLIDVSPELLSSWLADEDTVLIDVREDYEHGEEHIGDAVLAPLTKFDEAVIRKTHGGKRVVFYCGSGKRSADAADRYCKGDETVFHLAGGIANWKSAGNPTVRPATGPRVSLMRQVQIAAGFLVALGVALGAFVSPWFLVISGFVGCGLMFAGLSGWCGMAKLLAVMPWNKTGADACGGVSCGSA